LTGEVDQERSLLVEFARHLAQAFFPQKSQRGDVPGGMSQLIQSRIQLIAFVFLEKDGKQVPIVVSGDMAVVEKIPDCLLSRIGGR